MKAGSPTRPVPGWDLRVLDSEGEAVAPARSAPSAASCPCRRAPFPTLWNAEERFKQAYLATFPGYYETGDAGYIDEDGYVFVMARTDDIINVAGHRLSTGAMEEVLASHPDVAECAVIGAADKLKGQLPLGFLVLNAGVDRPRRTRSSARWSSLVREQIGPVAAFKQATVVKRLPKTRSGKILRGTMQKIADGEDYKVACHHRRSGHPGRDHRHPEVHRLSPQRLNDPLTRNVADGCDSVPEPPGPRPWGAMRASIERVIASKA